MAITGTGTEQDPYIVETWDELLSVGTAYNVYIEWSNDAPKELDFSDKIVGNIELSGHIDFKGLTINNLTCTSNAMFRPATGSYYIDLHVENFNWTWSGNFRDNVVGIVYANDTQSRYTYVTRCSFRGTAVLNNTNATNYIINNMPNPSTIYQSNSLFNNRNYMYMDVSGCSIELDIYLTCPHSDQPENYWIRNLFSVFSTCKNVYYNNIRINDHGTMHTYLFSHYSISEAAIMHDNFIEYNDMRIAPDPMDIPHTLLTIPADYNNVFNFKSDNIKVYGCGNAQVYNSDLATQGIWENAKGAITSLPDNSLIPATDIQIKDARWLKDHGIPIGVK